jgi:hypothetical protein
MKIEITRTADVVANTSADRIMVMYKTLDGAEFSLGTDACLMLALSGDFRQGCRLTTGRLMLSEDITLSNQHFQSEFRQTLRQRRHPKLL